ncbi:MAG: ATP-grasp domain-containing protein [Saprospiraceae bacterium]|nr:ATP-grasp domain-containing protein [Saprospiraceae bacterium]
MKKVLIANRGEIACRIARTIRTMGLESVSIFAEEDRTAPHVLAGDFAYLLEAGKGILPYLDMDQIVEVAKRCKADAIHPGYGFLSENADFARLVQKNGIIFIGPSSLSIEIMGDKLRAKEALRDMSVPLVPGTDTAISDISEAGNIAEEIGYPVLIKAAAGGGGKGMRIVHDAADLEDQFERAVSEATSAFGNGQVFLEKFIVRPKHIEVQILADQHGSCIHAFERDCSVQRRHQKVIEEAPAPTVSQNLREEIGAAAIRVAQSCNYEGAGTVEFLVDAHENFYFLEMNTRLQVEHPVTEMITGLDLVEEQIRIARGEKLRHAQQDLRITGHALELRIYAEDPQNDFLPDVGFLADFELKLAPGERLDSGYRGGMAIPLSYDPLLAKLIIHGTDRQDAIARMMHALDRFNVSGVSTTIEFGRFVFAHPNFRDGSFDTHFVQSHFSQNQNHNGEMQELAKAALFFYLKEGAKLRVPKTSSTNG